MGETNLAGHIKHQLCNGKPPGGDAHADAEVPAGLHNIQAFVHDAKDAHGTGSSATCVAVVQKA